VSLRGRAIAYLVALHVLFAAVAVYLFLDNPFWLIAIEVVFTASLVAGLRLSREMYRHLALTTEGLRLIREHEFTSRFLPVGQPEIDELIGIYNTMVDHLRAERVRVAEQHQFLSRVLQVSPSGIVILDFDGRVSSLNPAAERLLDTSAPRPRMISSDAFFNETGRGSGVSRPVSGSIKANSSENSRHPFKASAAHNVLLPAPDSAERISPRPPRSTTAACTATQRGAWLPTHQFRLHSNPAPASFPGSGRNGRSPLTTRFA